MADENEADEIQREAQKIAPLLQAAYPSDLSKTSLARIEQRALSVLKQSVRDTRQASVVLIRRAVALALVLVLILGSWGIAAAAGASLPGDILYPIKRLAETARLAWTPVSQHPALYIEFAERRLGEVEALAVQGRVLPTLLQDLAVSTTMALAGAEIAPAEQQTEWLPKLADLSQRQLVVLGRLEAMAPETARPALARAQRAAQRVAEWVQAVVGNTSIMPGQVNTPFDFQPTASLSPAATFTACAGAACDTPAPTPIRTQSFTSTGVTKPTTATGQPQTPTGQQPTATDQPLTPTSPLPTQTEVSTSPGELTRTAPPTPPTEPPPLPTPPPPPPPTDPPPLPTVAPPTIDATAAGFGR